MGPTMTPRRVRQVRGARDALAYTVDGQGLVLTVQEGQPLAVSPPSGGGVTRPSREPPVPADLGAVATPARLGRAGGHDRGRTA